MRCLRVVLAAALALTGTLAGSPRHASGATPELAGLSPRGWLAEAQRGIAAREYEASATAAGLQAPNRAHDLRTWFEPWGVRIHGRTAAGGPELVRLRVMGVGRGEPLAALPEGVVASEGARVEIRRPTLVEWYRNSPAGLEQGFRFEERPPGEGPLRIGIALGGAQLDTRPRAAIRRGEALALGADEALLLRSRTGRPLRYGHLEARDATGRELAARMEAAGPVRIVLVIEDGEATYPVIVDPLLTATVDGQLESDQDDARLGTSVASAGDVDGDGRGDLIVGAPLYDGGQLDEGAAFVAHSDGFPPTVARLESDQAGAQLGAAVAGVGDLNGDGYADVAVGAPLYDAGETDEGIVLVFLGSASGIADGSPATATAQLESDQAGAHYGAALAGAGDVDGDGRADLIVGAPLWDGGQADEGAAFVIRADAAPPTVTRLESDQPLADFGRSVASAGDVDGDGYEDVIVGAPLYDSGAIDEGSAFVFLGSAAGIANGGPGTAAAELESDQEQAQLGASVAGVGDVDGDGYADVLIGAPRWTDAYAEEGTVLLFRGGALGVTGTTPVTADARLVAEQAGAQLGTSVAGAGDLNGDGYADVILGTPDYVGSGAAQGAAFVFFGGASGLPSGGPALADVSLETAQSGDGFGASVAGGLDLDGDGYSDVLVGAPLHDAGETDEGAVFSFLGGALGIRDGDPTTAAALIEGDQGTIFLATSVAGAGDVDGDGYGDVIVGAPGYDAGQVDEGAAFVFHGSPAGIAAGGPGAASAQLEANQASALLGTAAAAAGDVNGDGYGDVIVGAPYYDVDALTDAGAAFVFLGGPAGVTQPAAARLASDDAVSRLGRAVAGAGDVNGDGYSDVIVGAPYYDVDALTDAGAAFVFLGSAAGIPDGSPATASGRLADDLAQSLLGMAVAGAGDLNGDGYADVVVGAPYRDDPSINEGGAFVFLGGPSGITDGSPTSAATRLDSNEAGLFLGASVAAAGDVNGDGYADLIVSAPGYSSVEADEGVALIYLGSAAGIAHGSPATADTRLESDQTGGSLGFAASIPVSPQLSFSGAVAGAGDVNGDGYADVIVGAPNYDAGQANEGAAFVFLGGPGGIPDGGPAAAAAQLESNEAGAALGVVAGAGDVNGDGFADVIVGANRFGPSSEGAAFVFLGGNGLGRPVETRQLRGDGSGTPVAPWGSAVSEDAFAVSMAATHPRGRGRVKLEVEACPGVLHFGDPGCVGHVSASWMEVAPPAASVLLTETVTGLAPASVQRWRARVLHAPATVTEPGITPPPSPAHGPWRRLQGQVTEADIRTVGDCSDGIDNDGDGLVDSGADPGCVSPTDASEREVGLPCDDGVDNDGDGREDFDPATFASPGNSTTLPAGVGDPGCKDPSGALEDPQCQNGVDDADPDDAVDYDAGLSVNGVADPAGADGHCLGKPWRNKEKKSGSCGLGFELAFALALWGRRSLRRRVRAALARR